MSHAAARLDMAVQTSQRAGPRAGARPGMPAAQTRRARSGADRSRGPGACSQAEQIFQLGEALPELARSAAQAKSVRLTVGIADGLPKLVVQRLLQPVLDTPDLRLVCHEGEMADLLADLAIAPAGCGAVRPPRAVQSST
jgi:LysR family transcriptional activator of nhaA